MFINHRVHMSYKCNKDILKTCTIRLKQDVLLEKVLCMENVDFNCELIVLACMMFG